MRAQRGHKDDGAVAKVAGSAVPCDRSDLRMQADVYLFDPYIRPLMVRGLSALSDKRPLRGRFFITRLCMRRFTHIEDLFLNRGFMWFIGINLHFYLSDLLHTVF